jgi:hypothetical protein
MTLLPSPTGNKTPPQASSSNCDCRCLRIGPVRNRLKREGSLPAFSFTGTGTSWTLPPRGASPGVRRGQSSVRFQAKGTPGSRSKCRLLFTAFASGCRSSTLGVLGRPTFGSPRRRFAGRLLGSRWGRTSACCGAAVGAATSFGLAILLPENGLVPFRKSRVFRHPNTHDTHGCSPPVPSDHRCGFDPGVSYLIRVCTNSFISSPVPASCSSFTVSV